MDSIESAKQSTVDAAATVALVLTLLDLGGEDPRFENQEMADELYSALELLRRATLSLDRALDSV